MELEIVEIKVDAAALGSVGKEGNQEDFCVTVNLLSSLPYCCLWAGESVGIARGPEVWSSFLARGSRVNESCRAITGHRP